MRHHLRGPLRSPAAAVCIAVLLSACGGGGGAGSASPGAIVATPGTTPGPASTKAVARTAGQSALTAVQGAQAFKGNTTLLGLTRAALDARGQRRTLATCSPGAAGGSSTFAMTFDTIGNEIDTYTTYYDAACTQPELAEVLTIASGSSLTSLTASATVTAYDRSGSVNAYATLTIAETMALTSQTLTVTISAAKSAGAAPFARAGITCSGALSGGPAAACGMAVTSAIGTPVGVSMALGIAVVTAGPSSTITETVAANTYTGSGLGIAAGAGTAWNVTGGTLADTVTGTIVLNLSRGYVTSGTIAMRDSPSGITIAGTATASGAAFTVTQGTTIIATVVVDATGTGTITYADGTTESISAWTLVG